MLQETELDLDELVENLVVEGLLHLLRPLEDVAVDRLALHDRLDEILEEDVEEAVVEESQRLQQEGAEMPTWGQS